MTQEEKAKAYDEVLNKLRHFMAQGIDPPITRADVQDFFPELKESEDERIRKALIEYFNEQCDISDWNGIYGYQVVAWLEKQGEQKAFDYEHATIQQSDFAPKQASPLLSNSANVGNPEDLEAAATKYAQDKYLPVQTAMAFMAGAEWMIEHFDKPYKLKSNKL